MNEPKSINNQGVKDFLLFCIKNDSISIWNEWRELTRESLENIELSDISLINSKLNDINFSNLIFINIDFFNSNLNSIDFYNTVLIKANFKSTKINDTLFTMSQLVQCNFENSKINGSNFEDAHIIKTNFRGAKLHNTSFLDVSFSSTEFPQVNLTDIDFRGTIYDDTFGDFEIVDRPNLEQKLFETEKKLKDISSQSEKEKIELEKKHKELATQLERLHLEKQKETNSIKEIITFLAAMPKEISEEQVYLKTRRKRFTLFGGLFLSLGVLTAVVLMVNILFANKLGLPIITNTPQYFAYALAIGFPMAMAFLFYRQANVKSKEIEKINEKSILVQQVENALNSYNVLLSGDELKDKTISSIDRVINKIFDNNHKEEKSKKIEESKLTISDVQKLFKMGSDITKS